MGRPGMFRGPILSGQQRPEYTGKVLAQKNEYEMD